MTLISVLSTPAGDLVPVITWRDKFRAVIAILKGQSVMHGMNVGGSLTILKSGRSIFFSCNRLPFFTLDGKPCTDYPAFADFIKVTGGQKDGM